MEYSGLWILGIVVPIDEYMLDTTSLPLNKLREGRQLTIADVQQLEQLISGLGMPGVEDLRGPEQSIGRFLRGVVGMDADAVYAAFADLLQERGLRAEQIKVLNMIVKHFVNQGIVEARDLAGPPFNQYGSVVDLFPEGNTLREISERVQQFNTAAEASETGA